MAAQPLDLSGTRAPTDTKNYHFVTLQNGIQALVVQQRLEELLPGESPSPAALALAVSFGSLHEPQELPGSAHFLEHMLFMGSHTFPDENEYDSYLSKHGGSSNAWTDAEQTCYVFDVRADTQAAKPAAGAAGAGASTASSAKQGIDILRGAMERFAAFFVSPSWREDAVQREVRAIHDEFEQAKLSNGARSGQVMATTFRPGHVAAGFILWKHSPDELVSHLVGHEGPGSILALLMQRGWATALSCWVPNDGQWSNAAMSAFEVEIRLSEAGMQEWVAVAGVVMAYIRMLRDAWRSDEGLPAWMWPELQRFALLRWRHQEEQEADEFVQTMASELAANGQFHEYSPAAWLTGEAVEDGVDEAEAPYDAAAWRAAIEATGIGAIPPAETISWWKDLGSWESVSPLVGLLLDQICRVDRLSVTLIDHRARFGKSKARSNGGGGSGVEASGEAAEEEDEEDEEDEEQADDDRRAEEDPLPELPPLDQHERWFGTRFAACKLPPGVVDRLEAASAAELPELRLPEPNPFLPQNLELVAPPPTPSALAAAGARPPQPRRISIAHPQAEAALNPNVWHLTQTRFRSPRTVAMFELYLPAMGYALADGSSASLPAEEAAACLPMSPAKAAAVLGLWRQVVSNHLKEPLYEAGLADSSGSLSATCNGLLISADGYSDTLPRVVKLIVESCLPAAPEEARAIIQPDRFEAHKQATIRSLRNRALSPRSLATTERMRMLGPLQPAPADILSEVEPLTPSLLAAEVCRLLVPVRCRPGVDGAEAIVRPCVDGLVTGNETKETAAALTRVFLDAAMRACARAEAPASACPGVAATWAGGVVPRPLRPPGLCVHLRDGASIMRQVSGRKEGDKNNCLELYWQVGMDGTGRPVSAGQGCFDSEVLLGARSVPTANWLGTSPTELSVSLSLLSRLAREPVFDSLRTKQQLGYTVQLGYRETNGALGFCLSIVSSRFSPQKLLARGLRFLRQFQLALLGERAVDEGDEEEEGDDEDAEAGTAAGDDALSDGSSSVHSGSDGSDDSDGSHESDSDEGPPPLVHSNSTGHSNLRGTRQFHQPRVQREASVGSTASAARAPSTVPEPVKDAELRSQARAFVAECRQAHISLWEEAEDQFDEVECGRFSFEESEHRAAAVEQWLGSPEKTSLLRRRLADLLEPVVGATPTLRRLAICVTSDATPECATLTPAEERELGPWQQLVDGEDAPSTSISSHARAIVDRLKLGLPVSARRICGDDSAQA